MKSILHDAFAHHVWATERLFDTCVELTREQLVADAPGTYGPIIATFHHLVIADAWYLSFYGDVPAPIGDDDRMSLAELKAVMTANGAAWLRLVDGAIGELDADRDIVEQGDGWEFHALLGIRLAQVIHHGTDHRSQICTALTSLGVEPPDIDVWAYGESVGRTWDVK